MCLLYEKVQITQFFGAFHGPLLLGADFLIIGLEFIVGHISLVWVRVQLGTRIKELA